MDIDLHVNRYVGFAGDPQLLGGKCLSCDREECTFVTDESIFDWSLKRAKKRILRRFHILGCEDHGKKF